MIPVGWILHSMCGRATHPQKIFLNLQILWPFIFIGLIIWGRG
jgi:phage gp29-like protein